MSDHPFRFSARYRAPALLLGITPRTAMVRVDAAELRVRFGLWTLRTPLANVVGAEETADFAYLKTVGPPHLSFADRGVTFATNADHALCVRFAEPVKVLDPTGRLLRHPAATLTVADPSGLATALARA
ncbi:hypothetical protein [Nocardioides sp.]|uniref:hypothetical protein n=1 Tax=Nocardioides sp. TaxID=35761 RepID=UPI002732F1B9|nr:hypothetical protein [Nocardioides sp.]MDP3894167.1 hypothetical protein [Nocardioides sp.]